MCLHEGQGILTLKDHSKPKITLAHGKHSHIELALLLANAELDLAPVKLTVLSRLVFLSDEGLPI